MEDMTEAEIKGMVGTPYHHHMGDGIYVEGVIAAFIPGKGFTCLATNDVDSKGESISEYADRNGDICLVGINAEDHDLMSAASIRCRSIRDTGEWHVPEGFGVASCGLS